MRGQFGLRRHEIRKTSLEDRRDPGVDLLTTALEETGVSAVLNQRLLEDIVGGGWGSTAKDPREECDILALASSIT